MTKVKRNAVMGHPEIPQYLAGVDGEALAEALLGRNVDH